MLNGKQIREVTAQGVYYVDENNVEQFIDFAQCYQNYINERLSPETWENHKKVNLKTDADWNKYVERTNTYKTVGTRNHLTPPWSDGPYIEFYTIPRVRFKFGTNDEWRTTVQTIRHLGHKLFDLG
jgi:hypothetical protein